MAYIDTVHNSLEFFFRKEAIDQGLLTATELGIIDRAQPDEHLLARNKSGKITASCSLWWSSTPFLKEQRTGFIGHFRSQSRDSGQGLLFLATKYLKSQGANIAIGPVDGNTWNSYRFVTRDYMNEPSFFLEPSNDPLYPEYFMESGFEILARYYSAISNDLAIDDERTNLIARKMKQLGVVTRTLDLAMLDKELSRLYQLSINSFKRNFLYTSIDEREFVEKYGALRAILRPELIRIAEHNGETVGFIFAYPDRPHSARIVLKTLARDLRPCYGGLGHLLMAEVQNNASELGYKQVIHALFHEDNHSAILSSKYAKIMRQYSLFFKPL